MKAKKVSSIILVITLLISLSSSVFALSSKEANKKNAGVRNIIVLIADGMSEDGVALTRWYNSYDEATGKVDTTKTMALDDMASGLVRTYWVNNNIPGAITDSAPAATAMATGVKTNNKFLGVDDQKSPLATILEAAKMACKSTGLISTSQVMHATPAGYSSHYPDRSKEYIIAEQQVYNNIDVVFGGGSKNLADRPDNENLIGVLKTNDYNYVTKGDELAGLTSKTWGMFAPVAMSYEMDRQENTPSQPSLAEMTKSAINILSKNDNGFFIMIEGSKIDWAAHANDPIGVISDINAFDNAVLAALDFAKKDGHTMVIAVTDHGNGGISIGNADTSGTYDKDPVSKFIAPLKKAKLTGEGLEAKFNADKSNIKEVMSTYYGINDLTDAEVEAIKNTKAGSMNYTVGPMISKRACIGWTTTGHTGEDIVLYSYLPGDNRITGTIDNTDLAKISAGMWNINLKNVTNNLYKNARSVFEAKGATVAADNSNPENPQMIVTKGTNTLAIPENKNYVILNGSTYEISSIIVNIDGTFYIPAEVADLIK